MTNFFKAIKNILIYKVSKDVEDFELLEDKYENGTKDTEPPYDLNIMQNITSKKKEKPTGRKTPLPVSKWNEKKDSKADNKSIPTAPDRKNVNSSLNINIEFIKKSFMLPRNSDVIIREFTIARKLNAFLVFMDGMVKQELISDSVLKQLMIPDHSQELDNGCPADYIINNVLTIKQVTKEKMYQKIIKKILDGSTALFIEGCQECLIIETTGYEKRAVEKPVTESVVRGSQEGFNENMRTNITLLRRLVRRQNLITEMIQTENENNPTFAIMYLEGVTNTNLINEVKRRLQNIKTDFMFGDGMLEQYIEDSPYMLAPQVQNTERPDRAASFINDGQVVILAEGSPFANIVPITFWQLMHTSEDSNLRWQAGLFIRLLRYLGLFIAVFLPGLYAAAVLFHAEMIPTDLLLSIAKSKENVPFPTMLEVLLMEVSFELIREAGIRVPGVIGTTIGIIGALIIGQAAVQAQIISPILVIIVAVTGLGNFAIPSYTLATSVRIIRFIFILLGGLLGFYGITGGVFVLGSMLCSMKSFGVPFLSPLAPKTNKNMDVILHGPIWKQSKKTDAFNTKDKKNQEYLSRNWITKRGKMK